MKPRSKAVIFTILAMVLAVIVYGEAKFIVCPEPSKKDGMEVNRITMGSDAKIAYGTLSSWNWLSEWDGRGRL